MNNVIDEKRKKRFQFLNALYEYSEGDTDKDILPQDLGKKFVSIIDQIAITHKGIITIENALSKPQEETEYFPPVSIVIMGNVSNSNIQLGNNNKIETEKPQDKDN